MSVNNSSKDCGEIIIAWHLARDCEEMALQPWVYEEGAAFVIHGTHILTVCYGLFQRHIRAVEPLIVVNMLSHESYWGLCAVRPGYAVGKAFVRCY